MNSKFLYLRQNYGIGFYLISLLVIYYTYRYQLVYKPCCDATAYQQVALHYLSNGLFTHHHYANLRLYGFSSILTLFYSIFKIEHATLFYALFSSLSYIALSFLIVQKLKLYVKNFNILHIAFAMNFFLFPYLAIPLADGMSVILWMLIFYLILEILNQPNKNIIYVLMFLCSYSIGMSIMVRPSNISLILLIPAIFVMTYFLQQKVNKTIVLLLLICGIFIAVLPQIYINFIFFKKISFLPAVELGNLQLKWGIEYIKYATNLSGKGIPQLYYKNPFYIPLENLQFSWYLSNFSNGIKTVLLHLFNVFSYDYYFPYIYNLYPKYKFLTLFYSWFILFYGIIGIIETAKSIKQNHEISKKSKFLLLVILPITLLGALSILAISAVEVRFSLPLVVILLPFTFHSFFKNLKNINLWLVFFLWLVCAFIIQSFVDLQTNILPM